MMKSYGNPGKASRQFYVFVSTAMLEMVLITIVSAHKQHLCSKMQSLSGRKSDQCSASLTLFSHFD